jgi:membrane-associated protein
VSGLAEHILNLHGVLALLLVFTLVALEASAFIGFLFPGEIACILGGVLAFQGRVSLVAAMAAAVLGAVIGDSVGYAVGRRYGERLLNRVPSRLLKPHHIARSKAVISRLGGKAVFVGRFTAALRVLVPGMCGMAGMRYRTFAIFNVAGGLVWAGGSVLLGYLAGASWRQLNHALSVVGLSMLGVVVVAGLVVLLVRRRRATAGERAGLEARPERESAGVDG